jgi:hypothetical protein
MKKSSTLTCWIGILIIAFSPWESIICQDEATWWNQTQQWDGITPWQEYIIYSPGYLGPNALPVPHSQKGIVKDSYEFQCGLESHFSNGDKTQNLYLGFYLPIVKNLIAIEFYGIPVEHYDMAETTVIERRGRHKNGDGFAPGDLYFSTIVQILRNRKLPDIALRMACKTASGSKLSDARFTDAPGYFFDISTGKDLDFQNRWINKLRFYGMIGFYAWQMNLPNNQQNDAILYGAGLDISINKFRINNAIEGYSGYFGNEEVIVVNKSAPVKYNDRPLVWRLQFTRKLKILDLSLGYQAGLNDLKYQSINISFIFLLNRN